MLKDFKWAAMKPNKFYSNSKIIAIIAFTFIFISLVIIYYTPPAVNYEISIYNVYPWYFWFFMLATIFVGQLIILKDIICESLEKKNGDWLLGLIVILIPIIILIFMPVFRGYPTYSTGDSFFHIGVIKDILQFGTIQEDIFYPNLHIITANLILITDGDVISLVNFIPRFFFFLAPISFYLFFLIILKNKNEIKFAMMLTGSFLFFGFSFMDLFPYYNSFIFMPIIMYLYFKRGVQKNTISYSLLFIIILISYIFYHPLNSLSLILVFLFLVIIFYIFPKIKYLNIIKFPEKVLKEKSLNILAFAVLLYCIWYLSFVTIVGSFYRVYKSIFYSLGGSTFGTQTASLTTYSPKLIDILRVIIYTYGAILIVCLLSLISLIYIFIMWWRNKQNFKIRFSIIFSGILFLIFAVYLAGSMFSNFIVEQNRFFVWLSIFSIILITIYFYYFISSSKTINIISKPFKKLVRIITICVILISITFLSTFTFYPSPISGTGFVNPQVPETEWKGTEWFQQHSNRQILTVEWGITIWRYYYAIFGIKNQKLKLPIGYTFQQPPDHFSYQSKTSLGEYYNENTYLIITHLGRIRYPEGNPGYERFWRFTPDDFNQLQNDKTLFRLYDNGDFEAYLIKNN